MEWKSQWEGNEQCSVLYGLTSWIAGSGLGIAGNEDGCMRPCRRVMGDTGLAKQPNHPARMILAASLINDPKLSKLCMDLTNYMSFHCLDCTLEIDLGRATHSV